MMKYTWVEASACCEITPTAAEGCAAVIPAPRGMSWTAAGSCRQQQETLWHMPDECAALVQLPTQDERAGLQRPRRDAGLGAGCAARYPWLVPVEGHWPSLQVPDLHRQRAVGLHAGCGCAAQQRSAPNSLCSGSQHRKQLCSRSQQSRLDRQGTLAPEGSTATVCGTSTIGSLLSVYLTCAARRGLAAGHAHAGAHNNALDH